MTRRLRLRPPVPADAHVVFAVHSDPAACAHNPSDALATPAAARELVERWRSHWRGYGFGYWVVLAGDEVVGFCGVKVLPLAGEAALNLFYRFAPAHWGRGLATEAARAVVRWAASARPEPVVARVRPANVVSQRVALAAGLVRAPDLDVPGDDGLDWVYLRRPGSTVAR